MIKVIEGQDPYNVIGKYIRDHITVIEDIIAVIKINEVETNQLFMVDGDMNKGNYFIWENDWWEGEKDVTLIDFFPVSEAQRANQRVQSTDIISRQAAIEALFDWEMNYNWDDHCREKDSKFAYIVSPSDVIEYLPPTEPEPQWIPVSKRLPEELKYVLVCTKRGYVTCGYCVNDFNYECVDKDFFLNLDDVVAWMPLPEPWKGEQDGN